MDSDRKSTGFLNVLPSFGSKENNSNLSSKDKRYVQQVEKAVASFDSLEEWADYIAFLSRLQKSLQLTGDGQSWIPCFNQVSNKLSLCLSSKLPNGVHQKTLSIYEAIFHSIPSKTLNQELNVWLPGLLPLFSYCSIQVKPYLINIYNYLLDNLEPRSLKIISKPIILSVLPGLDDENSEAFQETFKLVESLKTKLNDDSHFWQTMFLCIINNPERRLGALYWCNKRLPYFQTLKTDTEYRFSEEASACLSPEAGLLIRAFATSVNSVTSFNQAGDIIVIRGFFDLLLNRIPLNSDVLQKAVSSKDRELLIMSCCKVTLKKDMSLNRRLWNWFLGPDSSDGEASNNISRSNYFENYGLDTLIDGILKLAGNNDLHKKTEAFKISLAVIMDKWELSHLVTPRIASHLLEECYKVSKNKEEEEFKELLSSARAFFDSVEAAHIWNHITLNIILAKDLTKLDFLDFLLKNFDFHEDEMVKVHIPLAILALLANETLSEKYVQIVLTLVDLTAHNAFDPLEELNDHAALSKSQILESIKSYYTALVKDESAMPPFPGHVLSFLCLDLLRSLYMKNIQNPDLSLQVCNLFCTLLYNVPNVNKVNPWKDKALVKAILKQPIVSQSQSEEEKQTYLLNAFNFSKLLDYVSKSLTSFEKAKLLKIILSNIWFALQSASPANYQVEAVKHIFDLELIFQKAHIEAGILNLLLKSNPTERVRAFTILWTHSSSFNDADRLLVRPMQLLMDGLYENDHQQSLPVVGFIKSVLKSGSANRFLKLLTTPLLNFPFIKNNKTFVTLKDDLNQFSYYLKTVHNVIKTNEKPLKEAINNELAVMDSAEKIQLIRNNEWDISTYKTLILSITETYIKVQVSDDVSRDEATLNQFYESITTALELILILTSGNEPHFSDGFHVLLESCSYYIHLFENNPYQIELIEKSFLNTIMRFLDISEESKINLNLLHIEDEGKEPLLVRFLIHGITATESPVLLETWFKLLTRSLYLFNESVFSVLLTLNDSIIHKIDAYFNKIITFESFNYLTDVEASLNILTSGLEDLLSISHSYLLTSRLKSANTDKANNNPNDSGFFSNVIQGVLQIESPAIRTTEQNKLYSILLAFQDAVKIAFKIWKWSDAKPQVPKGIHNASDRSLSFLGNKLKFRSKKLLETLMDLERLEVIETLVEMNEPETVKLLHVLDGGRSQITLPHLLNSITTRADPQLLEEKYRSSLNVNISTRDLCAFLLIYLESVDTDSVIDIWDSISKFLRDAVTHSTGFKTTYPALLRVIKSLTIKLNSSRAPEQRKYKRELSDLFIKTLNGAVSLKSLFYTEDNGEQDGESSTDQSVRSPNEGLLDALYELAEFFDEIIQDQDKVNTAITSIVVNLLAPQIKSKSIKKLPRKTIDLMTLIGDQYPNKAWKTLVFDIFLDNNFFSGDVDEWKPVIRAWIFNDKEKFSELVFRVTPSVQSTASNIFIWNEKSEVENKVLTLKRISYLMMVQPQDFFLVYLESLFEKIEYSLSISCPIVFRTELLTLFRVITLKFSELHLLPYWITLEQDLINVFGSLLSKSRKELQSLTFEELNLVLGSCKLLDQLLLLRFDEFNLNEWLFVTSQPDVIKGTDKNTINALIDKIAEEVDPILNKEPPIRVKQPEDPLQPLLLGVKSLNNIANLRTFFESLSFISYERTFGLYPVDVKSCEEGILEDLLV